MKHINELTEQEILALTNEDVLTMIKLRKAEEGIKFIPEPPKPELFEIEPPDMVVYSCELFGSVIAFTSANDMDEVVSLIKSKQGKFRVDYNYEALGALSSNFKYATENLNKYSNDWSEIKSQKVYSIALYNQIVDKAKQNMKMQEEYDKAYKEYCASIDDSKWIEDGINDRVRQVRDKYYELNNHCCRFKNDYMPLANNDETVAMNFMVKAYALTDEQQEYVLTNYKTISE
jgi:hypothetical protein